MRVHLHILRAHIGPFIFSLTTLMFIFLLQFVMKFVDQLVGKGLGSMVISELIALNLAWMVVLAVPMSVLVATLMGFGSLASNNEITAMKASGISLYKMMATVIIAAFGLTYLLILFNNKVLPEANHRAKNLIMDIRRIKPTLAISPGLFSQEVAGYSILARKTFELSNDLEGVTIYDYTDPSFNVVVTAERGTVSFTADYRKLIMDLYDGEIHQVGVRDMSAYKKMKYQRHRIIMDAQGFDFERSDNDALANSRGDRELSAETMQSIVDSLEESNQMAIDRTLDTNPKAPSFGSRTPYAVKDSSDFHLTALIMALNKERSILHAIENQSMIIDMNRHQINSYLVEIHKKYSIPVACIIFVFIGAPLGIIARRGTFGVGASLSLGFFLLYWASLIGGEKLADRGIIEPWLGMWMANIVLGILGMYLTVRTAKETPALDISRLQKLIPSAWRSANLSLTFGPK
jgi:lipopolysaccharide export system permease protein